MPMMYMGFIAFEQQMFKVYYDHSKTGREIKDQLIREAQFIAQKEIDFPVNPREIQSIVQFKTLYKLQELKHACTLPNFYYLLPFAIPFSLVYPRAATITFSLVLGSQTVLFFNDIIKLKLKNTDLRTSRKSKELLNSSVTLMMVGIGAICGAVILKRGFMNMLTALKEQKSLSTSLEEIGKTTTTLKK